MIVTDKQLLNWSQCSLMTTEVELEPFDLLQGTVDRLVRWALLQEGRFLSARDIRVKFEYEWLKHFKDDPLRLNGDTAYTRGQVKARGIASRLAMLTSKYVILQPIMPYSLDFGDHKIQGEYALIQKRTGVGIPLVLQCHFPRTRHVGLPNIRSLARYLHARMTTEYQTIGIYEFCLERGRSITRTDIEEPLVHKWISHILEQMRTFVHFPSPGSHCERCMTTPCKKVFNV